MSNTKPQFGEFCWNELLTPDAKKAKEFYSALLGWEYDDHDVGGAIYSMLKHKGININGGLMQIPPEQKNEIPPHWMTYVNVENLDESVKKAKLLGATIKVPQTPISDFGRFAVIIDPTGAYFALWQSMKPC